jgi:hypothetical protein
MHLTKRQISKLNKIVAVVNELLARAQQAETQQKAAAGRKTPGRRKRTRRTSAEATKMRADILARRAKGVPAATLAEKYGVSTAYIYMIKD